MAHPSTAAPVTLRAAAAHAAAATVGVALDLTAAIESTVTARVVQGSAPSAFLLSAFRLRNGGSSAADADSLPIDGTSVGAGTVVSTTQQGSLKLPTGRYWITLTNPDATNAATTSEIVHEPVTDFV